MSNPVQTTPPGLTPKQAEARLWQLVDQGKNLEAVAACQQLNRQWPDYGPGWYSTSQLATRLGQHDRALQAVTRALQLDPGNRAWQLQQAVCLMRLGRYQEARPLVLALDREQLPTAYQCATLGLLLSRLDLQEQALPHYQRAARLEPGVANNFYNLATVHRFLGNTSAADTALEQALELDPADGEAWRLRADLRRWDERDNHVAELRALLAGDALTPRARVQVQHALAKELEDLERWEESFEALQTGATLRRQQTRYQVQGDLDTLARIAGVYDAGLFQGDIRGHDNAEAIFVIGMPRTGTTLVERILSSHSQVHAAGELNNFAIEMSRAVQALAQRQSAGGAAKLDKLARVELSAGLDFAALGRAYIDSTRPATAGSPRFVDKMPLNFLYAGLIHLALPRAKIVHLERHPLDSCFAIYKTLFADAYPFSYDLEELGRYYLAYRDLMQHWHEVMPGVIHEVRYEDLVVDQEGQSRALVDYCDLDWQDSCLAFHQNRAASTTASASQVREPIHARSVGRWRHYERQLAPLVALFRDAGLDLD